MSYLTPAEFATKMVGSGASRGSMSTRDTLMRAFMANPAGGLAFTGLTLYSTHVRSGPTRDTV